MISLNKYNFINEIKIFYQNSQQLEILLKETNSTCRDLLHQSYLQNNLGNFKLNQDDDNFINALSKKKICFIVLGQNTQAKSLIVNEILSRPLLPIPSNKELADEFWRIVKIKHGQLTNYTLQLVETEFEIMSSEQLNKKFTFTSMSPPSSVSSFSNSFKPFEKFNSLKSGHNYGLAVPIVSSNNFKIPLEDLQLGRSLIDAHIQLAQATDGLEQTAAKLNIELAEAIAENQAILEINLENFLLEENVEILIHSKYMPDTIFESLIQETIPIYLYGITGNQLSQADMDELASFQKSHQNDSIFFVRIPESPAPPYTASNSSKKSKSQFKKTPTASTKHQKIKNSDSAFKIFCQLHDLNYLNIKPCNTSATTSDLEKSIDYCYSFESANKANSEFCVNWSDFLLCFLDYIASHLKNLSVRGTEILFQFHEVCLAKLINYTYEMVRDTVITPGKIKYARDKEQTLFESLNSLGTIQQEVLKQIISSTIEKNREAILSSVESYVFRDVDLISFCDDELSDECVLLDIDEEFSTKLDDGSTGTDTSSSLTSSDEKGRIRKQAVKYPKDQKKCTTQIHELVMSRINVAIGATLADTIEILKDKYIGTLQRCLRALEEANMPVQNEHQQSSQGEDLKARGSVSDASSSSASRSLQQIINSAYDFDVNLSEQSNIIHTFFEKIKDLFTTMPWNSCPILDKEWKTQTANSLLNSISASKLSKIFCNQMKERLKTSHLSFLNSIKVLENKLNSRLEKNEECQRLIRKSIAPKFAKLSLESASLRDYLLHGFPHLSKEIGRGQYGVVYSCGKWGSYENLAIKSVVPPDEKHWNDLALEFHYSKQIIDHENIVRLLGTVIDYTYGNGQSPAILFVMERMKRDLYQAIKMGLEWKTRLSVSIDIVEGIRYLHSRGLVHRDIKLKNVLLDGNNRAKLTDLGFCKPNAMISGSIVGTPIHMSPEVFDAKYDSSVDIYAFGILFWYICSGSVHLPKNFEQCNCKDDLWESVKKGLRPERLLVFSDELWNLMERCWTHVAKDRPHIGDIANVLKEIREGTNDGDIIRYVKSK